MKRCIVFTFLGPILGLFGVALLDVAAGRGFPHEFGEGGVMSLIFSLIVSVVTMPVDGSLAYVLPIPLRAPLTAIVGATIAVGLDLALIGKMLPQQILMQIAVAGALSMGTCSLLSNDYRS